MSFVTASRNFYPVDFLGDAGGGVSFFNGRVMQKMKCVINGYFEWNLLQAQFTFTSSDKSILMTNNTDPRTFPGQGFQIGDSITIANSNSNNGTFTILTISNQKITVAESVTDEKALSADIHGVTAITTIDFYSNLIKNGAPENYFSLTDSSTEQKLTASGLDANDTSTTVYFSLGTKSAAWVTDAMNADFTMVNTKIKGAGISSYKQNFTITQYFFVAPFYLTNQFNNFQNRVAPDYFSNGNQLTHIFRVDGKFDKYNPIADQSGGIENQNGLSAWFDENINGQLNDYYVSAISYQDHDTSVTLSSLDINKNVLVTATLKSRSGRFANHSGGLAGTGTEIVAGFFACPNSESLYQNTQTTLLQNFFSDRCERETGIAGTGSGENYGTGYQAITNCAFTFIDANTITCRFIFSAGATLKTYLESQSDRLRNYAIYFQTQDVTIKANKQTDFVTCLGDFNLCAWDKTDPSLFSFTNRGNAIYSYPDDGLTPMGNLDCFEGDPFFVQDSFLVSKSQTIKNVNFKIVAKASGKADFIFEQKIISCMQMNKVKGIQQLSFLDTRGFISYDNDPRNTILISRDPGNDTTDMAAYVAQYASIVRYEDWISALQLSALTTPGASLSDLEKDFGTITQRWANYSGVNGWNLYYRFECVVVDNNGFENTFYSDSPITIAQSNSSTWSSETQTLQYFTEDESEEIKNIDADNKTLIRLTVNGTLPLPFDASGYYGYMFSQLSNDSSANRRFASSEHPSETSSPFTATDEDKSADLSWANGNVRINVYLGSKVVIESLFDAKIYGANTDDIQLFAKIGVTFQPGS